MWGWASHVSPQVSCRKRCEYSIPYIICLILGESTEREPKQPFTTLPLLAIQFHSGD